MKNIQMEMVMCFNCGKMVEVEEHWKLCPKCHQPHDNRARELAGPAQPEKGSGKL